jgi:hypothetical protein
MSTSFAMQAELSRSSTRSKSEDMLPLYFTCGSTDHSARTNSGTPAAMAALPKGSVLIECVLRSQLQRSAMASNGEADACTPLSPASHGPGRPRLCQLAAIWPRREAGEASAGSVQPRPVPRKSAQLVFVSSHSTTNWICREAEFVPTGSSSRISASSMSHEGEGNAAAAARCHAYPVELGITGVLVTHLHEEAVENVHVVDEGAVESAAELDERTGLPGGGPLLVQGCAIDAHLLARLPRVEHHTLP